MLTGRYHPAIRPGGEPTRRERDGNDSLSSRLEADLLETDETEPVTGETAFHRHVARVDLHDLRADSATGVDYPDRHLDPSRRIT